MAVLDIEIQSKIDDLINQANENWENREVYYDKIISAWNLYPLPKENWNEAYNTAKEIFEAYIIDEKIDKAKEFLNYMIIHNNNLHLFDYDLSFNLGKYYFEIKQFQKALDEWQNLVNQIGYNYFEDEDPKYLDFYQNPEKYIK